MWGTPAVELARGVTSEGGMKVRSLRTDGEYRISGSLAATIQQNTPSEKARITTWIVDQRRSGEKAPMVTSYVADEIVARRPLRMSERKQRFFLFALHRETQPQDVFRLSNEAGADNGPIAAWTECSDDRQVQGIIGLLEEEGLVRTGWSGGSQNVTITAKGFERMEALESGAAPTRQAFVAMWFDPSMDAAFEHGFDPAIREAGYKPHRIDRKEHSNKIDDEIIAEIRRSRFVIADFTCGITSANDKLVAAARGGVYYEAGFAQGLRIPVIWSCRWDCIEHVHFDTRQFNHIVWDNPADLRSKLLNRIRAVIV
jgi:hypothetical protein